MKALKHLLAVVVLNSSLVAIGQNNAYVTADNGLTVREQPNPNARRVGKLNYGEAITIKEHTEVYLSLLDEGEKIEGKWVKIETPALAGYVFDGFLSPNKVTKSLELRCAGFQMRLKNLKTTEEFKIYALHDTDSLTLNVELGDSPEGKIITISNTNFKRVSVFQRHENSVTIMNEGPHCDLTEWKHYYSEWRPIHKLSETKFKMLTYSPIERQRFMDIDITELKENIVRNCGAHWSAFISDIKTVQEYPAGVGISRIFLKILLTDSNDNVTEKVIVFQLPMGC